MLQKAWYNISRYLGAKYTTSKKGQSNSKQDWKISPKCDQIHKILQQLQKLYKVNY